MRDEYGKLIKVVKMRHTDRIDQKPDIRVLPYDVNVVKVDTGFRGRTYVKASRLEKLKDGLYELKEY